MSYSASSEGPCMNLLFIRVFRTDDWWEYLFWVDSVKRIWIYVDVTLSLGGDFIMVNKGDTFQTYSDEWKIQVVKSYLNGDISQPAIAKKYKLRSGK